MEQSLQLLDQIRVFIPILSSADVSKYSKFIKALNSWNSRSNEGTPSKDIISEMASAAKNITQRSSKIEDIPRGESPPNIASTPIRVNLDEQYVPPASEIDEDCNPLVHPLPQSQSPYRLDIKFQVP